MLCTRTTRESTGGSTLSQGMSLAVTAGAMDFESRPFLAIWELTQACDLACTHCRACAQPLRHPEELDTAEGKRLLDEFRAADVPLVVLTGGDPAKRPDLFDLVEHGVRIGLNLGLTPSATPLVSDAMVRELARLGLTRLAISIDGPDASSHDRFRGVSGSFAEARRILTAARENGITTQINTTMHAGNLARLHEMARLVSDLGARLWSVFYVVPTGRAEVDLLPPAAAVEHSLEALAEIAESESFAVKTTAAPHYRRVLLQRKKERGTAAPIGIRGPNASRINDGRGFVFVSHRGQIFPSGFLPLACGNVRTESVIDVYRAHPTFRALRDADRLTGKCGACEYRKICGGSRGRAYALTGDWLASDELCDYVPPGYLGEVAAARVRRRHLGVIDG